MSRKARLRCCGAAAAAAILLATSFASGAQRPVLRWLAGGHIGVESVAYSPDGLYVATGSGDETIKLWRASDGTLVRSINAYITRVDAVDFMPDGQYLVSGGDRVFGYNDSTLKLWNVATGELARGFNPGGPTVSSVDVSPDGSLLAAGTNQDFRISRGSDG